MLAGGFSRKGAKAQRSPAHAGQYRINRMDLRQISSYGRNDRNPKLSVLAPLRENNLNSKIINYAESADDRNEP
jgi:hypothetical protein